MKRLGLIAALLLAACGGDSAVTEPPPDPYFGPCSADIHQALDNYGEPVAKKNQGTTGRIFTWVQDGDSVTITFTEHYEDVGEDFCDVDIQL